MPKIKVTLKESHSWDTEKEERLENREADVRYVIQVGFVATFIVSTLPSKDYAKSVSYQFKQSVRTYYWTQRGYGIPLMDVDWPERSIHRWEDKAEEKIKGFRDPLGISTL